jgi:hypothetical protein
MVADAGAVCLGRRTRRGEGQTGLPTGVGHEEGGRQQASVACESVVEAIAQLNEDFARVEIVGAAKGEAVVEKGAAVGDVDSVHRN